MLSRPGPLPLGSEWSFELKWDGFRAIVSTEDGLYVRSRRGWDMTTVLPELRRLPAGLVLDGEHDRVSVGDVVDAVGHPRARTCAPWRDERRNDRADN
jgi:bifunctional non-homologous end joining protein LigD